MLLDRHGSNTASRGTDERHRHPTTLIIDVTKLDNSVAGSMGVVITFGDVRCESRRPFTVYAADRMGGNLFEGDRGFHELRCEPFTPASSLPISPGADRLISRVAAAEYVGTLRRRI